MPRKNLSQRIKQIYSTDAKYSLSLLTGLLVSVVVVKLNSKNLIFFNNVRFAIYFHFIAFLTIIAALIDVMMPKLDGLRATLKIRENSSIPIIILSAKSEDSDKVVGLDVGADDYITKPFNPLELVARVKSQIRRYTQFGNIAEKKSNTYVVGGLEIDDDRKMVMVDGEPVKVTPYEYNILLLLIKNPGRVYTIEQIYESVWNEPAISADNTVAVHIRHIREKIEINPKEPRYLKVVWGLGYKIEKM